MSTRILMNGSHYFRVDPFPLKDLFARLHDNTLDPSFEEFGNFIIVRNGKTRFWGNFFDVSHGFDIVTDEPGTIIALHIAIRENQDSARYREARKLRRLRLEGVA